MEKVEVRRGAEVMAQDGPIGQVVHVIVDEPTREISHLVVERAGQEWLLPADSVAQASGGQVTLRGNWAELRTLATPFAPEEFESLGQAEVVRADRLPGDGTDSLRPLTEEDTAPLPVVRDPTSAREPAEAARVQLREEALLVRKQPRQTGTVELGKEVVAEPRPLEVPVLHEELVIEHRPVERVPADGPIGEDRTITVVLHEETVHVTAEPVVKEVVRVERRLAQDTEHVAEVVRREVADVQTQGQVRLERP